MGNVYRGIPKHIALRLRDEYAIRNFIETGTNQGATAVWAAGEFKNVITIELQHARWQKACQRFKRGGNGKIVALLGDSRDLLSHLLFLFPRHTLVWLDAHWSGDLGYDCPERGECPVLDELDAINEHGKNCVVMIDDAHQFENPPNDDWPSFAELMDKLPYRKVWMEDDVIVVVPIGGEE